MVISFLPSFCSLHNIKGAKWSLTSVSIISPTLSPKRYQGCCIDEGCTLFVYSCWFVYVWLVPETCNEIHKFFGVTV